MSDEDLPKDIVFLKRRLMQVIETEEYESAAIIKRWIDELMELYRISEKKERR